MKKKSLLGRAFGRVENDDHAIRQLLNAGYEEVKTESGKGRLFVKREKSEYERKLFADILKEYTDSDRTGRRVDDAINAAITVFKREMVVLRTDVYHIDQFIPRESIDDLDAEQIIYIKLDDVIPMIERRFKNES